MLVLRGFSMYQFTSHFQCYDLPLEAVVDTKNAMCLICAEIGAIFSSDNMISCVTALKCDIHRA